MPIFFAVCSNDLVVDEGFLDAAFLPSQLIYTIEIDTPTAFQFSTCHSGISWPLGLGVLSPGCTVLGCCVLLPLPRHLSATTLGVYVCEPVC